MISAVTHERERNDRGVHVVGGEPPSVTVSDNPRKPRAIVVLVQLLAQVLLRWGHALHRKSITIKGSAEEERTIEVQAERA